MNCWMIFAAFLPIGLDFLLLQLQGQTCLLSPLLGRLDLAVDGGGGWPNWLELCSAIGLFRGPINHWVSLSNAPLCVLAWDRKAAGWGFKDCPRGTACLVEDC